MGLSSPCSHPSNSRFHSPFSPIFSLWILPRLTGAQIFPPFSCALFLPAFLPDSPAKLPCLFLSIILPAHLSIPVFPLFLLFPYFFPVSLLLFLFPQKYICLISEGSKKHLSGIKLLPGSCQVLSSKSILELLQKKRDLLICAVKSAFLWLYFQKHMHCFTGDTQNYI